MVFWGIVWGAVLGVFGENSNGLNPFSGAVLGLLAALWVRWLVRLEIAKSQTDQTHTLTPSATPKTPPPVPVSPASVAKASVAFKATPPSADDDDFFSVPAPTTSVTERPAAMAQVTAATRPTLHHDVRLEVEYNGIEHAFITAKNWLLGGNTIVRAGLVVLFMGLAFLSRYAFAAGFFPIPLRLAVVAATAMVLLVIGWQQRQRKPDFALALQGASVAVMYLTVFAAFRLYELLPSSVAFFAMVLVCVLGCTLALQQNSQALAVAAFAGGFAAPVLLATGQGNYITLFGYYSILNIAIVFIAHQRAWRGVNLTGFLSTFGVATTWGVLQYKPEQYAFAQAFLILFMLVYVLTAIFYARNTPTQLGNTVDSTLVFGTPLVGFGLQLGLVQHFVHGATNSALGFAAFYLLLFGVLARRGAPNYRVLQESCLALGVGFATLSIPLALNASWTSSLWALEGAAAFWVGLRQARWMPRLFGLLLQGLAGLIVLHHLDGNVSALPLLNPAFLGAVLVAAPALVVAWWLRLQLPHSGSPWALAYAKFEEK